MRCMCSKTKCGAGYIIKKVVCCFALMVAGTVTYDVVLNFVPDFFGVLMMNFYIKLFHKINSGMQQPRRASYGCETAAKLQRGVADATELRIKEMGKKVMGPFLKLKT